MNARASVEMAAPVALQRDRLKEAAVVMGKAKLVEPGVAPLLLTWLRPCVASLHQLYSLRPCVCVCVRGMVVAVVVVVNDGTPRQR